MIHQSQSGCQGYRAQWPWTCSWEEGAASAKVHRDRPGAAAPASPAVLRNWPLCTGARPLRAAHGGPRWERLCPILSVLTFILIRLAFLGASGTLHRRRACGHGRSTRRYLLQLPLQKPWNRLACAGARCIQELISSPCKEWCTLRPLLRSCCWPTSRVDDRVGVSPGGLAASTPGLQDHSRLVFRRLLRCVVSHTSRPQHLQGMACPVIAPAPLQPQAMERSLARLASVGGHRNRAQGSPQSRRLVGVDPLAAWAYMRGTTTACDR